MQRFLAAFLALLFIVALPRDSWGVPQAKLPEYKIKPGTLTGTLSNSLGRKLIGKKVEMIGARDRVLGSAITDEAGRYEIENLPVGTFLMKVDGEIVAVLTGYEAATVSTLTVIIPVKGSGLTPVQWTLIVAGGAVVLIGVPVIAFSGGGGSSGGRVSP